MNREIEFRFWSFKDKKMYNVLSVSGRFSNEQFNRVFIAKESLPGEPTNLRADSIDGVLLQYTGRKDVEGTKIFEGDIIKTKGDTIGDVQFSHATFGIEWARNRESKYMVGSWGQLHNLRRMDDNWFEESEIKVIGNIYENPELLK